MGEKNKISETVCLFFFLKKKNKQFACCDAFVKPTFLQNPKNQKQTLGVALEFWSRLNHEPTSARIVCHLTRLGSIRGLELGKPSLAQHKIKKINFF